VHIVQESMLLEGEMEVTMLENRLPHLLVPIAHQVIVVCVCKVHSVVKCYNLFNNVSCYMCMVVLAFK
jgi:hypothetical protein